MLHTKRPVRGKCDYLIATCLERAIFTNKPCSMGSAWGKKDLSHKSYDFTILLLCSSYQGHPHLG